MLFPCVILERSEESRLPETCMQKAGKERIASRRSFDFAQDDGGERRRSKSKSAKKSNLSAQQVLTGTKSRIFSYLYPGCRGHPCPRRCGTHGGFHIKN